MSKPMLITKKEKEKLEKELYFLKSEKRNEIAEKIKVAREFGDLSENAEYDAAREEQNKMEAKILEIEETLKNGIILDAADLNGDEVTIGTIVTVFDLTDEEEIKYEIVGKTEADPLNNKVSDQSPIGTALLGHKTGETVTAVAPGGQFSMKIINIEVANN